MLFRSEHVELKSTLPLCLHFKQVLICTEVMGKLALSIAKKQINSSPKKSSHNFLEKKKTMPVITGYKRLSCCYCCCCCCCCINSDEGLTPETSPKITLHGVQHTHINFQLIQSTVLHVKQMQISTSSYRD